jgi:hypothetical protein
MSVTNYKCFRGHFCPHHQDLMPHQIIFNQLIWLTVCKDLTLATMKALDLTRHNTSILKAPILRDIT